MAGAVVTSLLAKVSAVPAPDAAALPPGVAPSPGVSPAQPGSPAPSAGVPPVGELATLPPASSPAVPAPPGAVAVAQPGQPAVNKAIELRVTGHRTATSVGGATAAPGREFVIVDMAWKNLLPPQKVNRKKASDRTAGAGSLGFGGGASVQDKAADEANTTIESVKFEVGPLSKHLWLVADGRFAEAVDVGATNGVEGHLGPTDQHRELPADASVAASPFRRPAGAQALSILFLDANNGHILVPITGALPALARQPRRREPSERESSTLRLSGRPGPTRPPRRRACGRSS